MPPRHCLSIFNLVSFSFKKNVFFQFRHILDFSKNKSQKHKSKLRDNDVSDNGFNNVLE